MQLLTKEIVKRLEAAPFGSTEGKLHVPILVKYFNPTGAGTWYVLEGEKQENGDWLFFGLAEIHERELGYFSLSEFAEFKGPFGLGIERDLYFEGRVLDMETLEVTTAPVD